MARERGYIDYLPGHCHWIWPGRRVILTTYQVITTAYGQGEGLYWLPTRSLPLDMTRERGYIDYLSGHYHWIWPGRGVILTTYQVITTGYGQGEGLYWLSIRSLPLAMARERGNIDYLPGHYHWIWLGRGVILTTYQVITTGYDQGEGLYWLPTRSLPLAMARERGYIDYLPGHCHWIWPGRRIILTTYQVITTAYGQGEGLYWLPTRSLPLDMTRERGYIDYLSGHYHWIWPGRGVILTTYQVITTGYGQGEG